VVVFPPMVVVEFDLFELDPHAANIPAKARAANIDNHLRMIQLSLEAAGWSRDAETLLRGDSTGRSPGGCGRVTVRAERRDINRKQTRLDVATAG
jgi:hypothetical protein